MEPWNFINDKLQANLKVMLLWVLDSDGSSPGRRGFKMAVAEDGTFSGTIGGGIMEHKLVEKARALLQDNMNDISLVKQYHDKQHTKDQSGMICSGSQLIAFVPMRQRDFEVVRHITGGNQLRGSYLQVSPKGLVISDDTSHDGLKYMNELDWSYSEKADQRPVIYIIGGGHVGLALSELMHFLGFYIKVYDDRKDLSTMMQNHFAHEKHVVEYETIGASIADDPEGFLVIMTFGYRDDLTVFKQLINKKFFYCGMMGSEAKIQKLWGELVQEKFDPAQWKHWHMPIGVNIYSKTTKEIAVSIAAEIIREKNKDLPTGRTAVL